MEAVPEDFEKLKAAILKRLGGNGFRFGVLYGCLMVEDFKCQPSIYVHILFNRNKTMGIAADFPVKKRTSKEQEQLDEFAVERILEIMKSNDIGCYEAPGFTIKIPKGTTKEQLLIEADLLEIS